MTTKNSKGEIYYGMHFYPGVAEYQESGKEPYRVFLNEDTIRAMDATFAGRPIFVEHVDDVNPSLDALRKEADGWVYESFFNSADGKHWVKFIAVSEAAKRAIAQGMRLSNAYIPKSTGPGGLWNGVQYAKQITSGEYEHLAIVRHPRYQESVIMTPEEFKKYNEAQLSELTRLANSQDKTEENKIMAFKFFKKAKVENSADLEGMSVTLPVSGREITITEALNEVDALTEAKKKNDMKADPTHKVMLHDGSVCNVADLVEKHKAMSEEMAASKKDNEEVEESDVETESSDVDSESVVDNKEDAGMGGKDAVDEKLEEEKKKNALLADKKKADAKVKADRVRNAALNADKFENAEAPVVELSEDRVARGRSRYGA